MSGKIDQGNESKYVNIKILKELVSRELPPSSIARRIIMQENDSIAVNSFLEKVRIWFRILKEERQETN
jgi:hypothetical protein